MIWSRETEAGVFDTPERRAALEARLREICRAIEDESVRRHYGQALAERVAAFFPDIRRQATDYRGRKSRGRSSDLGRPSPDVRFPMPVSDRLKRSTILAGRAALPLREVVLVMTMVIHP